MVQKNRFFLEENSIWKGDLCNYVLQGEGLKQRGCNLLEVQQLTKGVMELTNKFFRSDGTQTDYEGKTRIKILGDRIQAQEQEEIDPNTGNAIKDKSFSGFILSNHIYIMESYKEEVAPGKLESRRNDLHYYFLQDDELISIVSVYVDDELLVFGNAHLKRME